MQTNKAIFVIGSPGSGKDVIIRDISSNYNIVEFSSSQINQMLSQDVAFKRAKSDKQNSLLFRESIIVNCKSYELDFVVTKHILESVGYSTYLILVEADLETAFSRIKNRNLQESFEKITQGNSNKNTILKLFEHNLIVDNSNNLDIDPVIEFYSHILGGLEFNSSLTIDEVIKPKLKSKLKTVIPGIDADARGEQITGWSSHAESFDFPDYSVTPVATGPMQQIKYTTADQRSDQDKNRTKEVLSKTKKILFKKIVPINV